MKYRRHLSRQILMGCLAFSLILGITIAVISFFILGRGMETHCRTRIEDAIRLTMTQIDADDLENCMETGEPSETFAALTRFLDDIRQNCSLDYIVICRPVKSGDDYDVRAVASGLLPEERAGENRKDIPVPRLGDSIGAMYPADFIPVIYDDMVNRRDIKYSVSRTGFGASYDGAMAILNRRGEGIALLTAGFGAYELQSTLVRYGLIIGGSIIVAAALLLAVMSAWLNRRFVRPLKLIERAAVDFAEKGRTQPDPGDMVLNRPDIHSGDELEALADTLVSMSIDMKTYAENMVHSALRVENMRQEVDRANKLATRDALTGVRNKAAFDTKVAELNDAIARGAAEFGLVMIDMNHLKRINDSHGHDKGDLYLKNGCKLICATFTHSPVYRVGGDEFVVVLTGVDFKTREILFGRFHQGMRSDPYLAEWERVSAAMGLAVYDAEKDPNVESVLARADKAMYEDKQRTRKAEKA